MSTKDESLQDIGKCTYACIVEMVSALECDYDRLEELKEERTEWLAEDSLTRKWDNESAFDELIEAAGDCESREDAETRIQEDPLSVEVRADWHAVGDVPDVANGQFVILLGTGGPATRIRGELRNGEPHRAWLEVQDWGTPWTQYIGADQDTLLTYARCFYFGEG